MKIPEWIITRLEEWNKLSQYSGRSPKIKSGRMNIPVRAFDTETLDGYVKLIACDDGRYIYLEDLSLHEENLYKILSFLTGKKYRASLNFFYNIDYDVAAIMKYMPAKKLRELAQLGETEIGNYNISYLPKKCLTIRKNKKVWRFFDLWQYYRQSLASAAERYLGDITKDPMDREKLGTDVNYWEKHKNEIIKYCIKDCQITAKLADILQKKLNDIGISFDKPFSTGTISIRYFARCYDYPKFEPTEWNKYAFLSYYGGRFEVIRKGYFDRVIAQDINSAYPYQISKLISLSNGVWQKTKDLNEDADLGFYKIVVEKWSDHPIQPFSFRDRGLVYYPKLESTLHFVTQDELFFALDNYDDIEITILDGWTFHAKEISYPFKDIERLYEERKKVKKTDQVMQLVLKIIMNSWYGKNAEKKNILQLADPEEADDFLFDDFTPVKNSIRPGTIFNPVYASLITARTRVMLLEEAVKHTDNVVAMFTDSLLSTRRIVESSSELGGWSDEGEGEALIIGCGVYTIRDLNKGFVKTRVRGMHLENKIDLIELAKENPDKTKIEFSWKKAIKPKEALNFKRIYTLEDINRFIYYTKHLDAQMDKKRMWYNNPATFGDLLKDSYDSDPLLVFP